MKIDPNVPGFAQLKSMGTLSLTLRGAGKDIKYKALCFHFLLSQYYFVLGVLPIYLLTVEVEKKTRG